MSEDTRTTGAVGEPGTKQPAPKDNLVSAKETLARLDEVGKQFEGETYDSSLNRAQKPGNVNKTPPHERTPSRGPALNAPLATAAGAIGAARAAITAEMDAQARIESDPRHERDQRVYEMGQRGVLPLVPPSEAEQAALAARSGMPAEVIDKMPKTPEEQVAEDTARLDQAEDRSAQLHSSTVPPGQQEMADQNNGKTAQDEGKTGEQAVARAKASESTQPTEAPKGHIIK